MADKAVNKSYNPAYYQRLFEIERKHFWFRSRNRVIAEWVRRLTAEWKPGFRVLEVGCGTGNILGILDQTCPNGTVIGMDLYAEGLRYARQRTASALVQGDVLQPPFASQFDIIGLFDVLEHLPDDVRILYGLNAMLRENGILLLTVPAHPGLWSYFDEVSHHCRRYQPDELKHKLIETGFEVMYCTQYMLSIFPLVWVQRRLAPLRKRLSRKREPVSNEELVTQELKPIPVINGVLSGLLDIERIWMRRGHTLPLGTSLLAVARKFG